MFIAHRFPEDFMFELTDLEFRDLRSQIVTSSHGGMCYAPFAFTEQGVAMLSSVLRSPKAIGINISIIRAFVFLRQYALSHKDLTEQLENLETKYDKKFNDVYDAIHYLLEKDKKPIEKAKIGFKQKG